MSKLKFKTYFRKSEQSKEEKEITKEIENIYVNVIKKYIDKHKPAGEKLWYLNIKDNTNIHSLASNYVSINIQFSSKGWVNLLFDSNNKLATATTATTPLIDLPSLQLKFCLNYLKKLSIMLV